MKRVKIEYSRISKPSDSEFFLIVLKSADKDLEFSVYIGSEQAMAITDALDNETPEIPFTHELIKNIIESTGFTLKELVINDFLLDEEIFKVHLVMSHPDNKKEDIAVRARIGDGLAIAFCFKCPIYANESVFHNMKLHFERKNRETSSDKTGKDDKISRKPAPYAEMKTEDLEEMKKMLLKENNENNFEKLAEIQKELNKRNSKKD